MRIFIDSADVDAINEWVSADVADGVTTNPTILKNAHADARVKVLEIVQKVAPLPVCVEVLNEDVAGMQSEARRLSSWGENVVVKIPVVSPTGTRHLELIAGLAREGIAVNATACLSTGQAVLAAKAGASYVSLFWGRIADEGGDPAAIVGESAALLSRMADAPALVVGSVRGAGDVAKAFRAGADVVTVSPAILEKWCDHHYSRATVRQFLDDAADIGRGSFD